MTPEYDDSFDMEALERFTQELTGQEPQVDAQAAKLAAEKARKDALFSITDTMVAEI